MVSNKLLMGLNQFTVCTTVALGSAVVENITLVYVHHFLLIRAPSQKTYGV